MRKEILLFVITLLTLAGCSANEYIQQESNGNIALIERIEYLENYIEKLRNENEVNLTASEDNIIVQSAKDYHESIIVFPLTNFSENNLFHSTSNPALKLYDSAYLLFDNPTLIDASLAKEVIITTQTTLREFQLFEMTIFIPEDSSDFFYEIHHIGEVFFTLERFESDKPIIGSFRVGVGLGSPTSVGFSFIDSDDVMRTFAIMTYVMHDPEPGLSLIEFDLEGKQIRQSVSLWLIRSW